MNDDDDDDDDNNEDSQRPKSSSQSIVYQKPGSQQPIHVILGNHFRMQPSQSWSPWQQS